MLKTVFRIFTALFLCAQLGACAAVMSGTSQAVFVETPMAEGASCRLSDSKKGSWYLKETPGSVTVQKGDGPMNVVCEKPGHHIGIVAVDEELDGATFGNILIGGVVGFVADAASGAAQKYPDKIAVWMPPREWVSPDAEMAWNRVKFEYEEAARLEKDRKSGRVASAGQTTEQQIAPAGQTIVYQPMYMDSSGRLIPAPYPVQGQPPVARTVAAPPLPVAMAPAAVQHPALGQAQSLSGAQTAYRNTGQQAHQEKIETAKPPAVSVVAPPASPVVQPVAANAAPALEQVYMVPVAIRHASTPAPTSWECVPGNKMHLLGTGCR